MTNFSTSPQKSRRRVFVCSCAAALAMFCGCGGPNPAQTPKRLANATQARGELAAHPHDIANVVASGKLLYQRYGCAACHDAQNGRSPGPSLVNIMGTEIVTINGANLQRDHRYLHTSLVAPELTKSGAFAVTMPSFAHLRPEEIEGLVHYVASLTPTETLTALEGEQDANLR